MPQRNGNTTDTGSISVLVIEDNPANMKLISAILEIGEYKVLEAVDAETGIDMALRYRPKMILMDITLPGMDGLAATEILKKEPKTKDIPVVAVTANATEKIKEKALRTGCVKFIPKPLNTRTFIESIQECFDACSPSPK